MESVGEGCGFLLYWRAAMPSCFSASVATLAVAAGTLCWAQPPKHVPTWNKIRYRGGTVEAKVNPYDWNTTLSVTPDSLAFVFGSKPFTLKPSQVVSLSSGVQARRKVGLVVDAVAMTLTLTPFGLFGLLKARQDHLIGIVYQTEDGKQGAILLETDNYQEILFTVEAVTGKKAEKSP
jgi:hypothetical protein